MEPWDLLAFVSFSGKVMDGLKVIKEFKEHVDLPMASTRYGLDGTA